MLSFPLTGSGLILVCVLIPIDAFALWREQAGWHRCKYLISAPAVPSPACARFLGKSLISARNRVYDPQLIVPSLSSLSVTKRLKTKFGNKHRQNGLAVCSLTNSLGSDSLADGPTSSSTVNWLILKSFFYVKLQDMCPFMYCTFDRLASRYIFWEWNLNEPLSRHWVSSTKWRFELWISVLIESYRPRASIAYLFYMVIRKERANVYCSRFYLHAMLPQKHSDLVHDLKSKYSMK